MIKARLFEKRRDWYDERVIGPAPGAMLHEHADPFSAHQGHSAAKKHSTRSRAPAMTPAAEVTFIALWQQGLETAAFAVRLGVKATTAQSRARRLQQRGLIQLRPRGGNYPTLRARERVLPAPPASPAA